jgi:hypothetical protein
VFLKENPDLYGKLKELVFKHYEIGKYAGNIKDDAAEEAATVADGAAKAPAPTTAGKAAAAAAGGSDGRAS